jgi:hypothetical protein
MDSWWISWPVGGLFGLGILHQKHFGDPPADGLYGKKFTALYVKWLFPRKKVCAQGSKRHFWVCGGNFCPE